MIGTRRSRAWGLACLLLGCNESDTPADATPSEAEAPKGSEAPSRCVGDKVEALAQRLSVEDLDARRKAVLEGLPQACALSDIVLEYMQRYQDALRPPRTREPLGEPSAVLAMRKAVCADAEAKWAEFEASPAMDRDAIIYDGCELARYDIIDKIEFMASGPASVVPFHLHDWLLEQRVSPPVAKRIAAAVALLGRIDDHDPYGPLGIGTMPKPGPEPTKPVPPDATLSVTRGEVSVDGALDPEVVIAQIDAHLDEVRTCHSTAHEAGQNVVGTASVQVLIGKDGQVPVSVLTERTRVKEVANCVAKASKGWSFPQPTDGGHVVVMVPFTFSAE